MTPPMPGPGSPPSAAERLARTLATATALLAVATVGLVVIGLARELLTERDSPVGFAAATAAVVLAAAAGALRLARHLRHGPDRGLGLPAERAKPTVPVAVGATFAAGGFAIYPAWTDWFFVAALGVFLGYFVVPFLVDRAALRAAAPAGGDEGNP